MYLIYRYKNIQNGIGIVVQFHKDFSHLNTIRQVHFNFGLNESK